MPNMTKEQEEMYEKIKATGKLSEEQLAKLRAGFEKAPRKIDAKKSQLHMDMVYLCQTIVERDNETTISMDWKPEDKYGNAYIYLLFRNSSALAGKSKADLAKAINKADTITVTNTVIEETGEAISVLTLGFMGIIQDPNEPDNFTAN